MHGLRGGVAEPGQVGRELLPRDWATPYPVSPTTDHLGALLMAPLNIAWLVQAWAALAATAYVVTARPALLGALVLVLLWAVFRNKASRDSRDTTEQATHDLYDQENANRDRSGDGSI